jgi:hypothetical protein
VEEEVEPQKTPKPGRIGREAQEDPKAQWTPKLGGDAKTPRGIPASSKGKLFHPSQESGFHRGEHPQVSQNPGSFERGRETEEGFCAKKPTGESKTPSHEKTLKTSKVASPKDLTAIDTSKVTSFLEGCIGNSRKRPHLAVGLFLPPFEGIPRGTPKGPPFPRSNPKVLEGVDALGNLRVLARMRITLFVLPPGSPYPWNGGTVQPDLPGSSWFLECPT